MKVAHLPALLFIAVLPWSAVGQSYTSRGVVLYAKALDVTALDPTLSHQRLDEWLRSGAAHMMTVRWAPSDCDLKPPDDLVRDWPLVREVLVSTARQGGRCWRVGPHRRGHHEEGNRRIPAFKSVGYNGYFARR